jgi:spore coat protein U domain-containing protein, fimbrial subunit CupE1/2/3/6
MKRLMLAAAFVLLAAAVSFAATTTATMNVSATLLPTVAVESTNLDFGDWFIGDSPHSATATVTVTATNGTVYNITLDAGNHLSGGTRNVANGADMVPYVINDPTDTVEWGDNGFAGTYIAGNPVAGTGDGSPQPYTANGVLNTNLASPSSTVGLYTDFVTVTVNY